MSISRAPAIALVPDLTLKPLRSKANAIINLMGAVGAILTLIALALLVDKSDQPDYTDLFLTVGLILLVSFAILRWKIDEKKMAIPVQNEEEETRGTGEPDKEVNISLFFLLVSIILWFMAYNGITTAFSRYAIAVWEMDVGQVARSLMLAAIAVIITYIPYGFLGTKIGRRKAILLGICLVSTTYLLGIILTTFSALVYLSFAIMGVGWAFTFVNVNFLPIIVEMSQVADVGKYTGMYYTASMAAQIVTPILSDFLMELLGFGVLFPYALLFSSLSLLTMILVRHGDSS